MAEIKVDLEAICECGAELIIHQTQWAGQIKVDACESCLNAKYDEGHSDGQKED